MRQHGKTLAAISAVAGVAGLAAIAPSAQAAYFQAAQNGVCKGAENMYAIGASGLRGAKVGWGNTMGAPSPAPPLAQGFGYDAGADYATCAVFKTAADGGTKTFNYRATGSGSCLTIMGINGPRAYNDGTTTVTDVGYCGTEDAPTEAPLEDQIAKAEGGPASTPAHPSEAQFLTIPVAQVAVSVDVRLPDGCRVADQSKRNISRDDLNAAFEGTITTWGEIFGTDMTASGASPTSAECRAKSFKRVVRKDNSGTTFLFKRYLQGVTDLPGGSNFDWRQPSFGGTLANNAWPADAGATAVLRGDANGAGSQLDKLSLQTVDGGIGYADVSTARDKSYAWDYSGGVYAPDDRTIWLRVQRIPNDTYNSPGVANAQSATGTALGSACVDVQYSNQPTTNLGQSWAETTAVPTPTDYSICGLNYVVTSLWGFDTEASRFQPVWAGSTAGEWRTVRDYLRYVTGIIRPGVGPSKLPLSGFARMPADVQATAQCATKQIGWLRASSDPQPEAPVARDPQNNDPNC